MTDFPIEAVFANTASDLLAGRGAELVEVCSGTSRDVVRKAQLLYAVQIRMVAVLKLLPQRHKVQKNVARRPKRQPLDEAATVSEHTIIFNSSGTRAHSLVCRASVATAATFVRDWMKSECKDKGAVANYTYKPIHSSGMCIGKQTIHISHRIMQYRGLLYCRRCGHRGPTRIDKLALCCEAPAKAGRSNLLAIAKGKLPQGMKEWPA